ncbi:2-C-methyl-D-erythritol 4-phosphate cytidylyltransferase [Williamsia sp. CHRR-6]|uniref:IspD/TarI family cytidylyltransferase n=1 Tax=Williamsia sp. CHRR-6 TaxID=2835871 RepID=UPI001BD9752C|nr:2-C-methyl-D-erythritol 4-phosphate cytidylyltransferase [Williamsia sp. CHRR-6]MBT0566098.1 2-C-methyl-D-erythritol 4-phosphate cytidylyltransferase [Williamsia sp. CHRR-6]
MPPDQLAGSAGVSLVIPVPVRSHAAHLPRFAHIADASPLAHCLDAMRAPGRGFDRVLVVAAELHRGDARSVLANHGHPDVELITAPDPGRRVDCLRAAVDHLGTRSESIVVHDLSRPLVSFEVRDRILDALGSGAELVVPMLLMVDSVKSVDGHGSVLSTIDRSHLRMVQYPRGMSMSLLRTVVDEAAAGEGTTDEVDVALAHGITVITVDGDPDGFSVGDRDVLLAEAILSCRLEGRR